MSSDNFCGKFCAAVFTNCKAPRYRPLLSGGLSNYQIITAVKSISYQQQNVKFDLAKNETGKTKIHFEAVFLSFPVL